MLDRAKTIASRVLKLHHAALKKPSKHTNVVLAHVLELTALIAQSAEFHLVCDVTGIAGLSILVYHVITTPEV